MIYATPCLDEAKKLGGPIAVITQGRTETVGEPMGNSPESTSKALD